MAKQLLRTEIVKNKSKVTQNKNLLFGIPTTGKIRYEWAASRYSLVIPCNWQTGELSVLYNEYAPLGYAVAEARNVVVQKFIEQGYEWLFFLDHDTIPPLDLLLKLSKFMKNPTTPVFCGIYNAKSNYPEPLIYRGRGNSFFSKWKPGEKIWVDGIPMGCTLLHRSLLLKMWEAAPYYSVSQGLKVKKVFETPRQCWTDPENNTGHVKVGTEDLHWCDRVINDGFLEKAGWKNAAKKKYPFLCDTSIKCGHIDYVSGRIF